MRNKIAHIVLLLLAALTLAGCNRPKVIPDGKLSDIFRDVYLVNAYTGQTGGLNYDSINIYEPILKKYGYTPQDLVHTIDDFTKRKSARLTDIVDAAIAKLDNISGRLAARVQTLDRIDSTAYALTKTVIYSDSLISLRGRSDSARMTVTIPAAEGRYDIAYYYAQDSTDLNRNLTNRHNIKDSLGAVVASNSVRIRKGRNIYTGTLEAPAGARRLELTFGGYPREPQLPMHLDIDSLVVVRYPTRREALERLLRSYIDFTLYIDGRPYYEYYNPPADSSALHIVPPLAPEEPDSVAVE